MTDLRYFEVFIIKDVLFYRLSCQMQYSDQEDPAQSIIGNNSHKVVDCSDERTGSNCRVDVDLFEE